MESRSNDTDDLFLAIEAGDAFLVGAYLKKGADLKAKKNNLRPMETAYSKGFYHIVEVIAKSRKFHSDSQDDHEYNGDDTGHAQTLHAMLNTCEMPEEELLRYIKLLVDAGTDTNNTYLKKTKPIHLAAQKGYFKIVRFLLENPPLNTNFLVDAYLYTLLYVLKNEENKLNPGEQYELASLLLKTGINVNGQSAKLKNTPLHLAVSNNDTRLITLFLLHNAKYDIKNSDKKTPVDINPTAFYQAWQIVKHNEFLNGIYIAIAQALRQNHPLSCLFKIPEIANIIFHHTANRLILNTKNSLAITQDRIAGIRINCAEEAEANRIKCIEEAEAARINNIRDFIAAYKILDKHEYLFSDRSIESQALVANMENEINSSPAIKELIDAYFMNKSLEELEPANLAKSRAVKLLRRYALVNNEMIEAYREQKRNAALALL
jgi:hypothetical protein